MKRKIAWFGLTGFGAAFVGALVGTSLMLSGVIIPANCLELALTFGLMGCAWGKKRLRSALAGILFGGVAGVFLGLLRIPADPVIYPIVEGAWNLIYDLGSGISLLTVFLLGYLAASQRRWLAGFAAGLGWVLGPYLGGIFMFASRDTPSWSDVAWDAFGVGMRGAAAGVLLAVAAFWRAKEDATGTE